MTISSAPPLTVAVLGLGYVGTALTAVLADPATGEGCRVIGIDVNPDRVRDLREQRGGISEPGQDELLAAGAEAGVLDFSVTADRIADADVILLSVGTPVDEQGVMLDGALRGAAEDVGAHLQPGQLVIVKSTVPPGATRELVPLLEAGGLECGRDFALAYSPERLSEGNAIAELREAPVVVGGYDEASGDRAEDFWHRAIGARTLRIGNLEGAETVKLASNWWIDHNIAMANELAKLCAAVGVDVLEVIEATNSIKKGDGHVNVLTPSVGVGGACLTKDPQMAWRAAQDLGVDLRTIPVARDVNDGMPEYTAAIVADELAARGIDLEHARIAVLGLAFKNNTGDLRATPTLPVVEALRKGGADVRVHEPLSDPDEVRETFGLEPEASLEAAVAGVHCVALLAWHDDFAPVRPEWLRTRVEPGCVVVDGRAYLPRETIEHLEELGFGYRGIGR